MKDLVGFRSGRLLVVAFHHKENNANYWLCKCDCGNEVIKRTVDLRSKRAVRSCGCLRNEKSGERLHEMYAGKVARNRKDIAGTYIGTVYVVSYAYTKNNRAYWNCKCQLCGKEFISYKFSCSCSRIKPKEDLVGNRYGRLTVEKYVSGGKWQCACDCGGTTITTTTKLKSGHTCSCGCYARDRAHECNFKDITGRKFGHLLAIGFSRYDGKRYYWRCRCDCGKELDIEKSNLLGGQQSCGCLDVSHDGSKSEKEINSFMLDIVGKKSIKAKVLDGKEIDIFYPDLNLGIEYNGSKFHATLGSAFEDKHKLYHQDKLLLSKEKGIHLINIFDVDWANNQDKIKMYLRSLVVPQKRLFARKCKVKEISRELAVNFTDKYHIQGSVSRFMKINYGLFFNDELYAVMSFGKLRLSKTDGGQYELHRYCVKDGYTILGGAEKLLKHFEIDYKPNYIRSYSDNDYFMGGIYERLVFENAGQCTPRYYWFLNGVELRREACQLKRLKEDYPDLLQEAYDKEAPNKEDYVMLKLGACKVYRSGNTKWEKIY